MTAFVHQVAAEGPGTHVFLVGIADYPHLKQGSGALAKWHFELGQLSSTVASVRDLADWFITHFQCQARPLKSVSLLLSEPGAAPATYTNPATGQIYAVPRGTQIETRDGLIAALAQVQNPDDQFIFYFAGHGLAGGINDFYLLRDFGVDHNGPLDAMINYADFMAGMRSQLPSQQLMIFDGCRDVNEKVEANQTGGTGLVTADPGIRLALPAVQQCGLLSTERDALSYGRRGAPSVCAQAFRRALGGAAGKRSTAGWNITSGRICEAMADFQTLGFGPNSAIVQKPDPAAYRDFPIRRLAGPPRIPIFMRRSDGGSLKGAAVTCTANGAIVHQEPAVKDRYWEHALEIGPHQFDVTLHGGAQCPPVFDAVSPTHLPIDVEVP